MPRVGDVDDALVRLRSVLRQYRNALSQTNGAFGISPLEALRKLAVITQSTPRPTAETRFDYATLQKLATRRAEAARALAAAARLGEFKFGPDDSPWYGVAFASTQEARAAHALAARLHATEIPAILERGYEIAGQSGMRPFETLQELGTYVRLLQDPRIARQVQLDGLRTSARGAHRCARPAPRQPDDVGSQPPPPAPAGEGICPPGHAHLRHA